MNSTLKRYKLRQLIEVTRGQSLSGEYYAEQGDTIRLTLANFDYQNGGFKEDLQKADIYYTGPIKPHCLLNEGDIITPLTEQTPGLLGSTARIPESGKYVQSGDVALIKCNEELIDPSFCYYLLPSSQVKKQLAVGSQQTKIRHTSPDAIKNCIVDIPDIEQQRKIGKLLDSITAKIDENRKQNVILEKMSKQLYDYWFVQFDFPDENGRPYKSSGGKMVWNETLKREIPEGWEVKNLIDIADIVNGATPSTSDETNYGGNIMWITPKDLSDQGQKFIFHGARTISQKGYDSCSTSMLPKGSILMSSRAPIGLFAIAQNEVCTNQGFKSFVPKDETDGMYLYYYLRQHIKQIEQLGTGTTFKEVSRDDLKKFPILYVTDRNTYLQWVEKLRPMFDLQAKLQEESEDLQSLRSYLLPLLMTGQAKLKKDDN